MRIAWTIAVCATVTAGCGVTSGYVADREQTLDPTKIYLSPFDEIETTRREVERYRCLNGAPLACEVIAIKVECTCPL